MSSCTTLLHGSRSISRVHRRHDLRFYLRGNMAKRPPRFKGGRCLGAPSETRNQVASPKMRHYVAGPCVLTLLGYQKAREEPVNSPFCCCVSLWSGTRPSPFGTAANIKLVITLIYGETATRSFLVRPGSWNTRGGCPTRDRELIRRVRALNIKVIADIAWLKMKMQHLPKESPDEEANR